MLGIYNLALMHALGLGTRRNCEIASGLFKNVAERGHWGTLFQQAYEAYEVCVCGGGWLAGPAGPCGSGNVCVWPALKEVYDPWPPLTSDSTATLFVSSLRVELGL